MSRFFNTTGACNPRDHYMLPPEARLPQLLTLVERKQLFVVHAARQTGKTTAMHAFAALLRTRGFAAVRATLEECQGIPDLERAEPLWISAILHAARQSLPAVLWPPPVPEQIQEGAGLGRWLSAWSSAIAPTPVVLLLDEADVVQGPAMISLLRQLRAGFDSRPDGFPSSVALVGLRDLRDYLTQSKDGLALNPGSPFNIKAASLTLRNFTQEEVATLYAQHTRDTGQPFEDAAIERAYYWTRGQPFLVNALADIATTELLPRRELPVTAQHIDAAKDRLILARTTHIDALAQRLREPRVATIVQAVLLGDEHIAYDNDDFQYVVDLGLIREEPAGAVVANPLYREILARQLTYNLQRNIPLPTWAWQDERGRLRFPALVAAFLQWWRENADVLIQDIPEYPEAIPHLAFMAFLQRVINGGGTVQREYAAGRGALDLLVHFGDERFVVELKRVRARDSRDTVREKAIRQTLAYLDRVGEDEAWILLFDQQPTWTQRLWTEEVQRDGRTLHLFGA